MEDLGRDSKLILAEDGEKVNRGDLTLTIHSLKRCRQRGIRESDLKLIMLYGSKIRKPGGAWEYFVAKKDKGRIIGYLKSIIQRMDKLAGKAVVVDGYGSTIITAYHRNN